MPAEEIEGQLNQTERDTLTQAVLGEKTKPRAVLEVGTWMGGGSTAQFLLALHKNQEGHLWGIEADPAVYEQMVANIKRLAPDAWGRFTPLFGFSQKVIPDWLKKQGQEFNLDVVFLDGGNNPMEQIDEFLLLADRIPVGGQLFSHDAKLRKGKWLIPYVSVLDNWDCKLHDISVEGLFQARKLKPQPSASSLQAAQRQLSKMRRDPVEIIGKFLPSPVCRLILNLVPRRMARGVAEGRK